MRTPTLTASVLAMLCLFAAGAARAESINCLSVNGRTQCVHGEDTTCTAMNGQIQCRSETATPTDPGDEDDDPNDLSGLSVPQIMTVQPQASGQSLDIEQRSAGVSPSRIR
jgi:hypothetical protein